MPSAWRLAALIDGLGVQMAVHDGVVTESELLAWVRTAACSELGLPASCLRVGQALADPPHPSDHDLRSFVVAPGQSVVPPAFDDVNG